MAYPPGTPLSHTCGNYNGPVTHTSYGPVVGRMNQWVGRGTKRKTYKPGLCGMAEQIKDTEKALSNAEAKNLPRKKIQQLEQQLSSLKSKYDNLSKEKRDSGFGSPAEKKQKQAELKTISGKIEDVDQKIQKLDSTYANMKRARAGAYKLAKVANDIFALKKNHLWPLQAKQKRLMREIERNYG